FPYMHDGRLYSLYKVVDHYTSGIEKSATLDPILEKPMVFSEDEKNDLVYFLHALKDTSFLNDKRFSQP
ncbi:MAG: cytochrome-c peroxidase, partial [Ginsengibacter sp.]